MSINRIASAWQNRLLFQLNQRGRILIPSTTYEYPNGELYRLLAFPGAVESQAAAKRKRRRRLALLIGMCLLIGAISAYDTYMLVKFQETIAEENPLGRWLMELDNGSVALFVGCKFAGTGVVLAAIGLLFLHRESVGLVVAATLSVGQVLLAWYVTFS